MTIRIRRVDKLAVCSTCRPALPYAPPTFTSGAPFSPFPSHRGARMPVWKVLLVVVFGGACLALGLATIIVPMTIVLDGTRWLWLAGLLVATLGMGTLFRLFLNSADRALK